MLLCLEHLSNVVAASTVRLPPFNEVNECHFSHLMSNSCFQSLGVADSDNRCLKLLCIEYDIQGGSALRIFQN